MKIIKGILFLGNIILILATLGAYIAPYLHPSGASIISFLGLIFPAILGVNILCIVLWLFLKPKYALGSLLILIIGINSISKIFTISTKKEKEAAHKSLKLGTFNMQFSKPIVHQKGEFRQKMEAKFNNHLKNLDDLDVLGVQECGWRSKAFIKKSMNFPYQYFLDDVIVGIYSKYPIINKGLVDFGNNRISTCLWVDLKINKDTIRVYTTHLEANRHDGKIPVVVNQEAKEIVTTNALLGIVKYYEKFTAKRAEQAIQIRAHQNSSPYPSIICGDFNDPPQTFVYTIMSEGLKDSFNERGFGIGTTFGNKIPGLRIDYILADSAFDILQHSIVKSRFSDHYLVESTVQF